MKVAKEEVIGLVASLAAFVEETRTPRPPLTAR